jgi:hypothetical protein
MIGRYVEGMIALSRLPENVHANPRRLGELPIEEY